jgi:hypothetical protein
MEAKARVGSCQGVLDRLDDDRMRSNQKLDKLIFEAQGKNNDIGVLELARSCSYVPGRPKRNNN